MRPKKTCFSVEIDDSSIHLFIYFLIYVYSYLFVYLFIHSVKNTNNIKNILVT